MWSNPIQCESAARRLPEILLGYLQAAQVSVWPGVDGLTVDDVVARYPEAVAQGKVPDWLELLRRHPELDAALHVWMADKDRWEFALRRHPRAKPRRRGHRQFRREP
jgi:hypothetical protein